MQIKSFVTQSNKVIGKNLNLFLKLEFHTKHTEAPELLCNSRSQGSSEIGE